MLQLENRLTLIDALRPPLGFELDAAMAVTFTLDLRALLAAPAAFVLAGSDSESDRADGAEPIELLHALRTHARKLTVFSQLGEIALPPSRRVFSFLERTVIPVHAPRGGVVHPKVWVLRYRAARPEAAAAPTDRLRVLVASRNLTFDASWDTVVRLDESADGEGAGLEEVGRLFEGLLEHARGPIATEHAERVRGLAAALETARFALPPGVDELNVTVLGLDDTASPLPGSADRSLIVAPFVEDTFFSRVRSADVDELVSRRIALDALSPGSLDRVGRAYEFDDGSVFEPRPDDEHRTPSDPGRPQVGLHAKVFAFERGARAHVFLGSANATGAAFANNVEILLELVGSRSALGIDRLTGLDDELGLRGLFIPYLGDAGDGPSEEPSSPLDATRRAIAAIPLEGTVEESQGGWTVCYRSRAPLRAAHDATIECWPLATAGNRRRVAGGDRLDACFETALENISGFLAFRITAPDATETAFVVPVELVGLPEARDRMLLRALIGSAERFLRYLLALLDHDPAETDVLERASVGEAPEDPAAATATVVPVLEKLLRTMRRDPAKLASLHPLVADLARDDALPPGFADLWALIHAAAPTEGDAQ